MGRRKDLTEDQRGAIIYGHQRGDSVRTIAVAVGCSKSVVQNIIQEYRQVGAKKKKRPGRSRLLSLTDCENLKNLVTDGNRRLNLTQITNLFNHQNKQKKISRSTVHRALHGEKLKSCVATQKPLISEENRQKRLDWAHAHKNWTVWHFKHILWSDKTMYHLFQGFRSLVWHESHEKWDLDCLSGTVGRSKGRMY